MADDTALTVDPKFVMKQHGKDFVLLGGLLDLAHRTGLRQIETEVLETLCNPEKHEWVVQATVRFRSDGEDNVWSALGEASPASSQMKGAYLRHAETRAIARALRWATNVAMCSFEELGPDAEEPPRQNAPRNSPEARTAPPRAKRDPEDGAALDNADDPLCEWPQCPRRVTPDQQAKAIEHFGKILCSQHEAQLAVVRSRKGEKVAA